MTRGRGRRLLIGWALALAGCLPAAACAADIERQRALFIDVYPVAERGDWSAVDALSPAEKRLLADYVLWPDLRAAFFRANLTGASRDEVEAFLAAHGELRPVRELRYRHALATADAGRHADYLAMYERFFRGMSIAKLDCLALAAEIAHGNGERVTARALELWLTGQSQDDACDPVFTYLADHGHLTRERYVERFRLAIDARAFRRARWLARSIDDEHVALANRWLEAGADPGAFLSAAGSLPADAEAAEQVAYAVERLTYTDPLAAHAAWQEARRTRNFPERTLHETARHIALWAARDGFEEADALLAALPDAAVTAEVHRWRARTSLRRNNWARLAADIERMPAPLRATEEWQYWRGIAERASGAEAAGTERLEQLARERSYYGFLAADELGVPYALGDAAIPADEALIDELAGRTDLVRARELYYVGLDGRGRSEWDAAIAGLAVATRLQAARLADRWGWHDRAIATAAGAGAYDDLSLRYPLPYRDAFSRHAAAANIDPTWAYGIARSESLFMRDVRSSAGAVGVMQLLPTTGRLVAKRLSFPYAGLDTLTDPEGNIRLGTTYLAEMAERFGGNRVLATAAYNAGPLRIDEWLPAAGGIDTRIWIETIPFDETRSYVRRVLAAETIFHWRMTGELRRLSDALPRQVTAPGAKLASN